MPLIFVRALAAGLAVIFLLLASPLLPDYMNRGLYQVGFMLIGAALLAEGVFDRRLRLFDSMTARIAAAFTVTLGLSFFLSDMDKFHLAGTTLNRLLWPVVLLSVYLAAQDALCRKGLAAALIACVPVFAIRMRICEGSEWTMVAIAVLIGSAVACAALTGRTLARNWKPALRYIMAGALAAIILGAGAGALQVRIPDQETDIVKKGLELEDAAIVVARQCVKDHPVFGHGAGSFRRRFLTHRPAEATMRGVPERLPVTIHALPTLAAEFGLAGLAILLMFIAAPLVAVLEKPRDGLTVILMGLACVMIANDILGGGWLLTIPGGAILFGILGLILACAVPPREREMPVSFFSSGLIVLGGFLLLQQIFWWKTFQIERRLPTINRLLNETRLEEAADQIDVCLVEYDPRRNELLSALIGAMHRAGRVPAALQNSQVLLSRDPDYPSVKNNIGTYYVMLGQAGPAIPFVEQSTQKHPTTESWTKLGHLYNVTGRTDDAKAAFFKAIDIFPREVGILLAKAPRLTDTNAQVDVIFQSAHFSANSLLRNFGPALGVEAEQRIVNVFNSERKRMKDALGMK